jgi:hypothetical protein
MKAWIIFLSCVLLLPVTTHSLESLVPKEIIEKDSNIVWKELPFKPNLLGMGFIYGKF